LVSTTTGCAPPHQQQVAFDAARIEVRIQAADDEHRVDVRRDHLLVVVLAGRAALDARVARQQGDDARALARRILQQHPVADGGPFVRRKTGTLPLRQRLGLDPHAGRIGDHVPGTVLLDHPRRGGLGMCVHRGPPRIVVRGARIRPSDRPQKGDVGHIRSGGFGHGADSRRALEREGRRG
jgi:hypothetical protein